MTSWTSIRGKRGAFKRGRPHRHAARVTILFSAGAFALAACGSSSGSGGTTTPPANSPIVIGASLSLSGDFSADGQAFERGYELWAAYQNAHGGLLGHQIKLDVVSDASDPAQVATNYTKLITVNHVNLVFGPFSTLLTVPASKITNRYGYAMLEGAGGAPLAFAQGLHSIFDVSAPVANALIPFAKWIASLPASERPTTAAYPTSNDPFTEPQLPVAQKILEAAGVRTVYSKVFPSEVTDFTPIADAVAASKAQIVLLGSVDVPTVSAFIKAFAQQHYNPKAFIATAGPDQGTAFVNAVGASNTEGVMVPNAWYPGANNPGSKTMVAAYVAKYGGSASGVNADVAEAFSVGQVATQAVIATHGFNQAKIIAYLHSGVTLSSVQGPVHFDSLGENTSATIFAFQWQKGKFVQVLPVGDPGSAKIEFPKLTWGG